MKLHSIRYNSLLIFLLINAINLLFFSCENKAPQKIKNLQLDRDSISLWLNSYKNETNDAVKNKYLKKAYLLNEEVLDDSLRIRNLLKIADGFYRVKEDSLFKNVNKKLQLLSRKLNDSSALAESQWNYGAFYVKKEVFDSGYYYYNKANKLYQAIGDEYSSGKMLYNLAFIEGRLKNYTGSEVLTFKAISKFKPLKKHLRLYYAYNHLGTIYKGLEEFEKAIFYFEQAYRYLEKVTNKKEFVEGIYNNMGKVYLKKGDYKTAKFYFNEALNGANSNSLNSALKARLIDNLAYTRFLNGETKALPSEFYKALDLRVGLNNKASIITSKLHLAEYYAKFNDTSKAIIYANYVKDLALETSINVSALKAYKLLSKLDKVNESEYLKSYIFLKDSLELQERKTRNKFTRIRFETDEYVEETERLSQQKIWISIIAITFIFILSLLYFIKQQRTKNIELEYEAEQQKYNEEIYELILKQQAVLEEGRLQERHRISEELHDGVLSKLFGTRMGIGFLDLKGDSETLIKHNSFIEELQGIEKEIRVISHELKNEILSTKLSYTKIIESLVNEQSKIVGYSYNLEYDEAICWDELDEKIKMNLYRITQEALQNINKYANASEVNINFDINNNTLQLSIRDNGKGFDTNKIRNGIGLSNMHSRMKKIGGTVSINSILHSGTTIIASITI